VIYAITVYKVEFVTLAIQYSVNTNWVKCSIKLGTSSAYNIYTRRETQAMHSVWRHTRV